MKIMMAIKYLITEYFTTTYVPTQTGKIVGLSGVAKVIMMFKFLLILKCSGKVEHEGRRFFLAAKLRLRAKQLGTVVLHLSRLSREYEQPPRQRE
jgi:hypothetical protein